MKYYSKYYAFKASIKEQSITIKDKIKIWIFNNFSFDFKTYFIIINNWIQKDKKLENNKVLFKVIEKKDTYIKAKHKTFANFALTKSNTKYKIRVSKEKK